jgi:hypothetical protein
MGRDRITNNSLGNSKDNTPIGAEGLVLVDATAAFIVAERKEKGQVKELNGTGFSLKSGSHFLWRSFASYVANFAVQLGFTAKAAKDSRRAAKKKYLNSGN